MAINKYGWRKFVTPIVAKVMASSAEELIVLSHQIANEVEIYDPKGTLRRLPEIDPFTFLSTTACRNTLFSTKLPIIRSLENKWGLSQSNCSEAGNIFPMNLPRNKYYFQSVSEWDKGDCDSPWLVVQEAKLKRASFFPVA